MKQLAQALENTFDTDTSIGRMVLRSKTGSRRRSLPNVKPRKKKNNSTLTHEQEIMHTLRKGFGLCLPCNRIDMKPGTNVLAHGRPAVVKWCLQSTPESYLVVVLFDETQEITRKPGVRSRWAMVASTFIEKIKW
jgi:hypothetical protein